LEFLASYHITS